jgi:hypothetical protein
MPLNLVEAVEQTLSQAVSFSVALRRLAVSSALQASINRSMKA